MKYIIVLSTERFVFSNDETFYKFVKMLFEHTRNPTELYSRLILDISTEFFKFCLSARVTDNNNPYLRTLQYFEDYYSAIYDPSKELFSTIKNQ